MMNGDQLCEGLFNRRYIEVLADENLKRQLNGCLKNIVFKINELILRHKKEEKKEWEKRKREKRKKYIQAN